MLERGTIFVNEHDGANGKWNSYTFSKSGKTNDGLTIYASMPIKFVKGAKPPENKAYVELKDSFLAPIPFGKDDKGKMKTVMAIICSEYAELVTKGEYEAEPKGFSQLQEDDIPFR